MHLCPLFRAGGGAVGQQISQSLAVRVLAGDGPVQRDVAHPLAFPLAVLLLAVVCLAVLLFASLLVIRLDGLAMIVPVFVVYFNFDLIQLMPPIVLERPFGWVEVFLDHFPEVGKVFPVLAGWRKECHQSLSDLHIELQAHGVVAFPERFPLDDEGFQPLPQRVFGLFAHAHHLTGRGCGGWTPRGRGRRAPPACGRSRRAARARSRRRRGLSTRWGLSRRCGPRRRRPRRQWRRCA